jgi:hypothetical protein
MFICFAFVLSLGACSEQFNNPGPDAVDPEGLVWFQGLGVAASCLETAECRDGLNCDDGQCTPGQDKPENEKCLLSDECGSGLHCSWSGFCVPPTGEAAEREACASSSDCLIGHYCEVIGVGGFCKKPEPDAGDLGHPCTHTGECMLGLVCSLNSGTCSPGSVLLTPDLFRGVFCDSAAEEEMPFGVRMALPVAGQDNEFYGFPFPNDVRLKAGTVDVSDHPRPGPGLIGVDPIGNVIDAIGEEITGWSINSGIFMRFTREINVDSVRANQTGATVRLIDLNAIKDHPVIFQFNPERNKYICENHLFLHPLWSRPLKPKTTYAALVLKGITSLDQEEGEALDDLPLLLDAEAPLDSTKNVAWLRFQKLRDWMDSVQLDADKVLGATVFTTGDPYTMVRVMREAVLENNVPQLAGFPILCEAGTTSPCATPNFSSTPEGKQGLPDFRDCPETPNPLFHEVHTLIRVPVFQEGQRPYETEGGAIAMDGTKPKAVGVEEVCMSITVPKGATPEDGWPVILYGHGTGGGFRTGARLLSPFVSGSAGNPNPGFAVVTLDQPMHGPRKLSDKDPGPLFYNFANPAAARGNNLQGASENFSLIQFITQFTGLTVSGVPLEFDASKIAYHGHSQGGATGMMSIPYEPAVDAFIVSGTGGSAAHGILGKTEPYDSSVGIRVALHEVDIDETHPALHLMQLYFDATDPLTFAPLFENPPSESPMHFLGVYGQDDHFNPPASIRIMAAATRVDLVVPQDSSSWPEPGFDDISELGMTLTTAPVSGNREILGQTVTQGWVEHFPDPETSVIPGELYDGHFVIYRNIDCRAQLLRFLDTWVKEEYPLIQP